jgi:hypothetical protein
MRTLLSLFYYYISLILYNVFVGFSRSKTPNILCLKTMIVTLKYRLAAKTRLEKEINIFRVYSRVVNR